MTFGLTRQDGYSLIELSVVMVIVGILVAGAVGAYDLYLQQKKVTTTRDHQETIKDALDEFLAANGRYPCPAPIDAPSGDANMGTEICTSPIITVVVGMRDVDGLPGNDPVLIGTVPTRTLNLSDQIMRDGYNRRMTYAVSATLTDDALFNNDNGVIAIEDTDGNSAITPANAGHYIVTSHGPDGLGAYSAEGALYEACAGGTKDTENCDYSDAVFISTLQRSTATNATHYDDFTLHAVKLTPLNPLAGMNCPAGQVITGFDDIGQPICANNAPTASCPSGKVLTGFDSGGSPVCINNSIAALCPSGKVLLGLNSGGGPVCVNNTVAATCPGGKAIRVISSTGQTTCVDLVTGSGSGGSGGCSSNTGSTCYAMDHCTSNQIPGTIRCDGTCSAQDNYACSDGDEALEDVLWLYEKTAFKTRITDNRRAGILN